MTWSLLDTWIVIVGSLCAVACALPGCLLVLRRMSMMGDAISHTVLPGLAIAFLVTQSRAPLAMFAGALIIGVLTAVLVEFVQKAGRTEVGASMGIVFTTLFAIGLILIRQAADAVDLDPDCVLYGAIETAYLDQISLLGWELPRAAVVNAGAGLANLLLIGLFYKEFKISSFDPALATTLGINARIMHYLLMTMTAATTVAAFETVGSILVIAMLIVPGATAYLLTDRLGVMFVISAAVGVGAAVLGHVAALVTPGWLGFNGTSTAGMMAFMAGVLFVVAWMLAPRHGLVSKLYHRLALSLRIIQEDTLGLLYRLEELHAEDESAQAPALLRQALGVGPIMSRMAMLRLVNGRKVRHVDGHYALTDAGRDNAANLVRSHRLWEVFLHKHLDLPGEALHGQAERLEHVTDAAIQERLSEVSDQPTHDPHGRRVPR